MIDSKMTTPITGLQLVKLLAENGYRLFSASDVRTLLLSEKRAVANLKQTLFSLASRQWIHKIRRNLYVLDNVFLEKQPIHEFEIGTRLAVPSAISHYSAFHIHELTEQIPLIVYAMTPTGTAYPRMHNTTLFTYQGVRYRFVQVKKEHFFGTENIWVGEAKIPITDLERTLLDGLVKPQYCGGIREVIHSYTVRKFDIKKILDYALRLDAAVAKRLGWVLEKTGHTGAYLKVLEEVPRKGYVKLDPSGKEAGIYNKRWRIVENL